MPEASWTTSDAVSARNPHAPGGLRRHGASASLALLPDAQGIDSSRRLPSAPVALVT